MTPTKKQIAEVSQIALEMNYSVESALKTLSVCSLSLYKSIGAKGVVEASMDANRKTIDSQKGGVLLTDFTIEKFSEKAYFISGVVGMQKIEKWVAKSVISAEGIIPFWALKK